MCLKLDVLSRICLLFAFSRQIGALFLKFRYFCVIILTCFVVWFLDSWEWRKHRTHNSERKLVEGEC